MMYRIESSFRRLTQELNKRNEKEKRRMSEQLQFAPFREYKDFIGQAENYAIPDIRDPQRLSNRITNNLLYYQTNYMLFFGALFVLISIIHPMQVLTGVFLFVALAAGYVFLTNKSADIQRLKRDKPFLNLVIIIGLAGFLFNMFGSLLLFLYSICLPLSSEFLYYSAFLKSDSV